jgi:hypothetical protein
VEIETPVEPSGVSPAPVDVIVGAAALLVGTAVEAARPVARTAGPVLSPVVRVALDPPLLPASLRPRRVFESLGRRGAEQRAAARARVSAALDTVLPLVVGELLKHADLTQNVIRYVDLDRVVAAVDLDAAAGNIDLATLAEQVIDDVDLPEIIRESTGSMASDTVRGARMQSIAADEAVHRAVRRFLLRRGDNPPPDAGP